MNEQLVECYIAAIKAVEGRKPSSLESRASSEAEILGYRIDVSLEALVHYLGTVDANDPLSSRLQHVLGLWDAAEDHLDWAAHTEPRTLERRQLSYDLAGLAQIADSLNELMPVSQSASVIITDVFDAWYPNDAFDERDFYWSHYVDYLRSVRMWSPEAISSLTESTNAIVERLAEPTRTEAYAARGLVVGYVQSGKTANFTGVIARAIDAGYRLVIVLTGTIEILRKQTQRRIDMELTGIENITLGRKASDPENIGRVEYVDDPAWRAEAWVSHGDRPSRLGFPDIIRLTDQKSDYKSLAAGITALELQKVDKRKPMFHPTNLFPSGARLAVVKKNKGRLEKLVKDLKTIEDQLVDIPVLIIDDESDQASLNTTDPGKWRTGEAKRTTINRLLSDLLRLLPRAQYVGYTATPYANVFVDPGDAEDIFPRHFILSLDRPGGYMGLDDFHDMEDDRPRDERPLVASNERCHVRDLVGTSDAEMASELSTAIDAFVLTAAVKLFRQDAAGDDELFRHHTMLIHQSVKKADHAAEARSVDEIWDRAEFLQSAGLQRLRDLWDSDFAPVCAVRSRGETVPRTFDDMKPFLSEAVQRITPAGGPPYIVVNGDKDLAREDVDFDHRRVWRILIGGAKLSRGFTVEGLTISYYRRRTQAADTLMQMGRWFGFRPQYSDLVRLYIGRSEPAPRGAILDLYDTFEGVVRDEDDFRNELRRYATMVDGKPQILPRDVAPLVSQHLPYLRPTARNKMFNAELVTRRSPGVHLEPNAWSDKESDVRHNFAVMTPIAAAATESATLPTASGGTFQALVGVVEHARLCDSLRGARWLFDGFFAADLAYFDEAQQQDLIEDWLVVMPQQTAAGEELASLPGIGLRSLFKRSRRDERGNAFGYLSESRHRHPAHVIAEGRRTDAVLDEFLSPKRGGMLLYPVYTDEKQPEDAFEGTIVLAPYFVAPSGAQPPNSSLVQFKVKDSSHPQSPIIDV